MKRGGRVLLGLLLLVLLVSCAQTEPLPWTDDFSSPGAWQAESDATAQVVVENGVLRVRVIVPNQLAWAMAGKDLRDFHLSVEATQVAGPDDNEYGVLVRMQDSSNFYRFSISGDGYFLVSKFVGGRQVLLGKDWTPSDAIRRGEATNVVEVIYQADRFTFVVNGEVLAQGEDGQFSHGDIALYAGAFYEGGVEVHFDNLSVTRP